MAIGIPTIEDNFEAFQERSVLGAFLNEIWGKPKSFLGWQYAKGSQTAQIVEATAEEISGLLETLANIETVSEEEDVTKAKAELILKEVQGAFIQLKEARRRNNINLVGEGIDFLPIIAFGINMILSPATAVTSGYSAMHKYGTLNPQLQKIGALVAEHFPETTQEDTSFSAWQEVLEAAETILEFIPSWGRFTFVMTLVEIYLTLRFRKQLTETHVELYNMAKSIHVSTGLELSKLQSEVVK